MFLKIAKPSRHKDQCRSCYIWEKVCIRGIFLPAGIPPPHCKCPWLHRIICCFFIQGSLLSYKRDFLGCFIITLSSFVMFTSLSAKFIAFISSVFFIDGFNIKSLQYWTHQLAFDFFFHFHKPFDNALCIFPLVNF